MPYLDFHGHKIAYRDHGGEGTPVLLVHGFPFDSEMWEPQVDALGDRFRFVTMDLLGFGESDSPKPSKSMVMNLNLTPSASTCGSHISESRGNP